jgi:hypothetical protein
MFHIELRQFPHNLCRFNLTEVELRTTIVDPWAREQWIELGERKWSPHQARLTVLEGPELPVSQLSMGRGWRNAQRQGQDVTERLLAAVRDLDPTADPTGAAALPAVADGNTELAGMAPAQNPQLLADSLGLELLAALGSGFAPLQRAWELADSRGPGRAPSESLALAELTVRSLLRSGLLRLSAQESQASDPLPLEEPDAEAALCAPGSWAGQGTVPLVLMRRS